MARKKILSVALAAVLTVSTVFGSSPQLYHSLSASAQTNSADTTKDAEESEVVSDAKQVDASGYGLCDNTKDGAILHAFCWSFHTIKENMADIAEAGYTTVQTSPINACNATHPQMKLFDPNIMDDQYDGSQGAWWWHYQPTDWTIGNYQLGTRDEYIAMCDEADKYGIRIISDVLPNHTTPDLSQVSQNLINAAGGIGTGQLYHSSGFEEIRNYSNRTECTLGQMGGLPDVNTENQGFQKYYVEFCNDVVACGGDGFRYDTAKHIGVHSDPIDSSNSRGVNDFWDVATGAKEVNGVKFNKPDNFFIYGEVLQDNGIPYNEYASYMNMTASSYGYVLRDAVGNNSLNTGSLSDWCHATPDKIVTWVESHDTYCNKHETAWMTDWQIRAGWAVIAARANGTPLFFSRPDGSNGSANNYWGNNVLGAKGNDQFKHPEVAACNHFRNAMVGETEYLSNFGGNSCMVIERGTRGAVIINMGSQVSNVKLNKVADGTYTEEVSGTQVQVSGGTLNYTVPGGSIAVVYNPTAITKNPSVSVSKDSGTFTEPFELKLTPSNATKATYSINGGDAVEFTKATTVKIGADAQVGDKITVKVTAEGDGDPFSKTFTYTMSEEPEIPTYKIYVRTKKSDYSSAPSAYVYTGDGESAKKLNGEWPGSAMKEEGDYYVYATNDADSAQIIFSYDGGQDPAAEQPGYIVKEYMEYDKNSKKVTSFTPPTSKPRATGEATDKPADKTKAPETTPPVKETEAPTEKPADKTKAPATTPPAKATDEPAKNPTITVSKEDGTSFSTETMDVKITLSSGTKGTYSVDNGPEKSFTSSTTVELGKGKIADSDVTLKVKASGETKTFTYKKEFDPEKATVKTSAISKIQSLFEVVSDAAVVNTPAESDAYYATNPNGVGKEATITGMADFTQDMLVARCGAWDVPNAFHGAHENSVADCYGLYAAWDNDNLYVGLEMVNTTDTWARGGDGPLSDGGKLSDVPVIIAINTGKSNAMTGKCPSDREGHIWQCNLEFETRIDHLLVGSAKVGTGDPGLFTADANGDSDYTEHLVGFKDAGITYKAEDGSISPEIMHIVAPSDNDTSDVYDISKYKDAMTMNHDRKYDTFFTYTIPLKALNIDKAYIESNGVGIMGLGTRQTSALDCIPHDPSMLDNTFEDYSKADDNTSHEKEDLDIITVPLAAVGNAKGGGEGGNITQSTKEPTKEPEKTDKPAEKTEAPEKTAEATKVPEKTAEATEKPKATDKATAEPKPTEKVTATEKPSSGTDYEGDFTVNFGADRSSPQYQTTLLTLKAIPYGGSGDYTYEFQVDGSTIQKESDKDNCEWKGTEGSHTIKVIVKDGDGSKITCEKSYDLEAESGSTTQKPDKTDKPSETDTPSTDNGGNTGTPGNAAGQLTMSAGANMKSPQVAGTSIKLSMDVKGGTAPYKYTITVEGAAYGNTPNILLNGSSSNSCQWTPLKSGTYKVNFVVEDKKGDIVSQSGSFKISSSVSISKFTANKYKVKKGKKVKFSMAATSTLSSSRNLKYRISVLKSGSSSKKVIRKYAKSKSYSWKATKKGKYSVYLTAKDTKGNTKTVKLSKMITVK